MCPGFPFALAGILADALEPLNRLTSIIGSCPLIPAFRLFFAILTSRSLPLKLAGICAVTSKSAIVCVHLYGSLLCSSSSLALASLSRRSRSEGVGEAARSAIIVCGGGRVFGLRDAESVPRLVVVAGKVGWWGRPGGCGSGVFVTFLFWTCAFDTLYLCKNVV